MFKYTSILHIIRDKINRQVEPVKFLLVNNQTGIMAMTFQITKPVFVLL